MKSIREYTINGKKYYQKELVLGQLKQITPLLENFQIPQIFTAREVIEVLGDKLPIAIAIIIREQDKALKDKDIELLVNEFEENLEVETAIKIIEDFFQLNNIDFFFKKLKKITTLLIKKIASEKT